MDEEIIFDPAIQTAMDSGSMSGDEIAKDLMTNPARQVGANDSYGDVSYYQKADPDLEEAINGESTPIQKAAAALKTDDKSSTTADLLKNLLSKDKTLAALIASGAGMLGGASTAQMQQKLQKQKWEHEAQLLQEARARADAHAMPGIVGKATYSKGTGLLESMK